MRLTIDYLQLQNPVTTEEKPVDGGNGGNDFVDKTTKLIVEHLSDSEFTIDQLCREMAMSRTLFYVKLKSYTGKSPQDFIRVIRLERASALLRSGRSVTDAATLAGFDNPKYFSTVFKKYFGVSPSKYQ
jgi:AraC-like DNA-binding protein